MLRRPFVTPTLTNESPAVRAKAKREFKEILREAVWHFGATEVAKDLHDITVGQRGDKPDEERNERILAERDAAGSVTQSRFMRISTRRWVQHCHVNTAASRVTGLL
jgi:hypothetical protein